MKNLLKIVTWNLRCANAMDDARGCGWRVRLPLIVSALRKMDADIVAVQETKQGQMDDLRAAFPLWGSVGAGRDDGKNLGEQCGIFFPNARFDLREQQMRWLSPTPDEPSLGWGAQFPRVVTRVHLFDHQTQRDLQIWNAHLDHESENARLESARQLTNALQNTSMPAILCGDFNCEPGSPPLLTLAASGKLRHAREHSRQAPTGPTVTFPSFEKPPLTDPKYLLDHIFVTKEWEIERYDVPADNLDWPPPSDHRPIVVELAYR